MRDSDVRAAVRQRLHTEFKHDPETRIVEEMGIWSGSVRIDIAVINGKLSGFELKSDRDTLERLPFQADLYSRVFDQVHLVVGARHIKRARELVPSWWGVIVATQRGDKIELTTEYPAGLNPSPEPYLIAQLLWKEEAIHVLEIFGLDKGWRAKRVKPIHQRLATELPLDKLKMHVRSALKMRTNWLTVSSCALTQCDGSRQ